MERTKRNIRKKVSPEPVVVDEYHSLETPSCHLVVQVVKDIIPDLTISKTGADQQGSNSTTTTSTTSESSLLGTLVLQQLLDERRSQASIKRKPKKKRKKKHRTPKTTDEDGDTTSTNATSPQQQLPQQSSHTTTATTLEPHETIATMSNSSRICGEQTSPVVLQWLDRLARAGESNPAASTTTTAPATPSTTSATTSRNLTEFCESLATKPPPTLFTSDISKALARSSCIPCRAAAESYWHSTGIPMQDLGLVPGDDHTEKIVLESTMIDPCLGAKRSIPITGMEEDFELDRAFDYQAMEEGLPSSNQKACFSQEEQKANQIVTLEPVVDKEGKIEAIQVTSELDAVTVERLIRQVILPCGLTELEHPNAVPMNDEQLTLLEGHVMAHQKRMHHQLTQLREKKSKVDELFFATAMKTAPTTGYDVKTATALTNCNNECEQLSTALVSILLQITTLTDGLPSAEWAHFRTKRLWESYEHGLQKILNKSLQHEGKLLQLASRPGVVPTLFMNAAHRFSFYEVIKEKYSVLDAFYVALFSTLHEAIGNPGGPTFLRQLMVHQPFNDGTVLETKTWLDRTDVDNTVGSLVRNYAELVQNVPNVKLAELQNTHQERCRKLFKVAELCKSRFSQEYDSIDLGSLDQSIWNELRREGTLLISHYETYLPIAAPVDDNEFNSEFKTDHIMELAKMRQQLAKIAINMTLQWRCLRWMRSQTVQAPVMPLRLLKFMNQRDIDNPVAGSCQGGGGKRRVAGVLASLLYLHLVVLCNEWHAEITQSELLESMGQWDAPNEVKAVTKKRKKKKGYPSAVLPLPAEKASETRSADSSDSDEIADTQTSASSMIPLMLPFESKKPLPESYDAIHVLDVSPPSISMNGFHKLDSDKDEACEKESEPDLIEERDVELILNAKKRRRNVKAAKQSDVVLVKNAIHSRVEQGKEVTMTEDPRTASLIDATNSEKLKERQRKPSPKGVLDHEGSSPQKDIADNALPSPLNVPSNPKKPNDTIKPKKRVSPSESGDSNSQTPPQYSKQRRPPLGAPATSVTDSKSSVTIDPKNSKKQPSIVPEIVDAKSPNATKQNKASSPKEVIDQTKYDGSTKQRKPSPPKATIDTPKPNHAKQRTSSPPGETITVKGQQSKESRKQRKLHSAKVGVDPKSQEPKGIDGSQRTASPPKEANNVGRHKDSGKRDSKTNPKNKGGERKSGDDNLENNKSPETIVSSEESLLQRNDEQETHAETNGAAKGLMFTNDIVLDNSAKETSTIQKPNTSNQFTIEEENSAATPAPLPTVSIGLEDSSGTVEPVEDFLVSRFLAILEAGSLDAKGNPIVFL